MKHLILANWKMSPGSPKEAQSLFDNTKNIVSKLRSVQVIIAVPSVFIQMLASSYGGNKVQLAAQDISTYEDIANTGSLNAKQFASIGAKYVLIGHSETGDKVDDLRIKTFLALKNSLSPIIFVGESKRDNIGKYLKLIKDQMMTSLQELSKSQIEKVIFCYEPIWSVGQDKSLDTYEIHTIILYMRKILTEEYGLNIAQKVQILYGGSVNIENIEGIIEIDDLNGVAIGRASTDTEQFTEILKLANKV